MSTAFLVLVAGPVATVLVAALVMIVGFILTTFVSVGGAIAHREHPTHTSAPPCPDGSTRPCRTTEVRRIMPRGHALIE